MTNEEAIKVLKTSSWMCLSNNSIKFQEAIEHAYNNLKRIKILSEENTKLKAEIEQLKWKLSSTETQRDLKGYDAKRNADIMSSQLKIIKQLKSELEQSVRLPCKVGQIVYEIKSKFTKCTEHDCEVDDYSCQGCECLECDSKKEYHIRDIKFYSAENILAFERHFGKTIFLTREEAEQAEENAIREQVANSITSTIE